MAVSRDTRFESDAAPRATASSAAEAFLCRLALSGLRLPISIVLPSGVEVAADADAVRYRVHLASRAAVLRFCSLSATAIAELYRDGLLEVEGDLVGLLTEANRRARPPGLARRAFSRFLPRRSIGARRARRNADHHYGQGEDFFASWLDSDLSYTCAYFADDAMTLAQAQTAKMELICRKLRLSAGETVIEAGCGWGGLARHMAGHHGVRVRAFNVSGEQIEVARRRASEEGLADRIEFVAADYREIGGRADAFVSVGMLEHIGPRHYPELGAIISKVIGARGRALLHTIGRVQPMPTDRWIDRHVFPDGYSPSLGEITRVFEPNDLAVLHVENLRHDYARTLALWLRNFDAASTGVLAVCDPRLLRTWRLYLASSQAAFLSGWAQLFQLVVAPRGNTSFRPPGRD